MNKKLSARIVAIFLSILMAGSGLTLIISLLIQLLASSCRRRRRVSTHRHPPLTRHPRRRTRIEFGMRGCNGGLFGLCYL